MHIGYELKDSVATLTLNRPDVLNSFNRAMALEVQQVLTSVAGDPKVRCLLITGSGRAFCAGQDLAEVGPKEDGSLPSLGEIVDECYNPIILAIRQLEKPVVCAVNGVAAGAGANLALACDFVIAASNASFIQSFCKIGLIPDSGGTFMLPRLVGLARATALTMLGEKISAETACNMGMIYKVCTNESLLSECRSLASHLAMQPTLGLGLIKKALNASFDNDIVNQLKLEEELQTQAGLSTDYSEGVSAFLAKRKPNFIGS